MSVGSVKADVLRPLITEADGEPIAIGVRKTGGEKLLAYRRLVEGKSAAEGPVRVRPPGCADTCEPRPVPLLGLVDESGAVRAFDTQLFDDTPVRPLNFGQQRELGRDLLSSCEAHNVGGLEIGGSRRVLELGARGQRGRDRKRRYRVDAVADLRAVARTETGGRRQFCKNPEII